MSILQLQSLVPASAGQEPFLIFLHIQKTGGMTLQRMLRKRYGPTLPRRAVRFLASRHVRPGLKQSLLATRPRDRFIAGHFCYGVHELLPAPSIYVTMLRRPVERLVSLYHYSRAEPHSYYHRHATRSTLEQFLLDCRLLELDNGQLRFILGQSDDYFINRTPFGQCGLDMLEQAKRNIDRHFALAGVLERFDQSVLLLQRLFGWSNAYYLRVNEGTTNHPRSLDPKLYHEVEQRNSLDLLLYDYAKHRVDSQVELLGDDFQRQLATFRRLNGLYNQTASLFYRPYTRLKHLAKHLAGYRRSPPRKPPQPTGTA